MQQSIQEALLSIPLTQLSFLTSLPKDLIHYETVIDHIPGNLLEKPTLIILENIDEIEKLNKQDIVLPIIQDLNLIGVVVCAPDDVCIDENIYNLFQDCGLSILQVYDSSYIHVFKHPYDPLYSFSQASIEIQEFSEKGFIPQAEKLAFALNTSIQYFDQNGKLLWQIGENDELIEGMRCFNLHRRELKVRRDSKLTMEIGDAFEVYTIQLADSVKHSLLTSSKLPKWQKKLIDKLVGLTAISLQTRGILDGHQKVFKEHFIYDLFYHKFESKRIMVKQGKIWGWNLERPHHLILIDIELDHKLLSDINWQEKLIFHVEAEITEPIIIFPFQDHIVILLEDGENRINSERQEYVLQTVGSLEKILDNQWEDIQFNIGIGKWYEDTLNLNKSFQEAKLALKFGKEWFGSDKKIYHINNLGVLRLLIHTHHELLSDFSEEYLSGLIESDREQGTEFIKTLQTYIQYDEKVNEVSELLFVHPNTLRKRLKRIEEITGLQFNDSDDLMTLKIAVRILSFIENK